MHCRTAMKRIQERWDQALSASCETELQEHLRQCSNCRDEAEAHELSIRWLHELPQAELSDKFDWRLRLRLSQLEHEQIEGLPPRSVSRFAFSWKWEIVGAAAAAAAVVLLVGWVTLRAPLENQPTNASVPSLASENTQAPESDHATLPDFGAHRPAWFKVTPVSSGTPLGPEQYYRPAPSILGDVAADSLRLQP